MSVYCYKCNFALQIPAGQVGRSEICPGCKFDVRVCFNCKHYDVNFNNQCKEPSAERVVDKAKSNFCDYFSFKSGTAGTNEDKLKKDALKKLDSLFK
jgi:hypothetical protein